MNEIEWRISVGLVVMGFIMVVVLSAYAFLELLQRHPLIALAIILIFPISYLVGTAVRWAVEKSETV